MYALYTDGGTLMKFLDNDIVATLLKEKADKVSILENGEILMLGTVIVRYTDPDNASTFLYEGYKLRKEVDN